MVVLTYSDTSTDAILDGTKQKFGRGGGGRLFLSYSSRPTSGSVFFFFFFLFMVLFCRCRRKKISA